MTQNNITDIEKCARLMGYERRRIDSSGAVLIPGRISGEWEFNPRTNKGDLVDVETELEISVWWFQNEEVNAHLNGYSINRSLTALEVLSNHPTKFAARAEAVIAVAVQIYDAKYGKDGE